MIKSLSSTKCQCLAEGSLRVVVFQRVSMCIAFQRVYSLGATAEFLTYNDMWLAFQRVPCVVEQKDGMLREHMRA